MMIYIIENGNALWEGFIVELLTETIIGWPYARCLLPPCKASYK